MSSKASIPTELYQANVDLAVRIASLLQENGKSWIDLFTDASGFNPSSAWPEFRAGGAFSLEKLASLPADAVSKLFKGDNAYWKNLFSSAVKNQHSFAEGLREAVEAWQSANRKALEKAGGSVAGVFGELKGVPELFGVFKDYLEAPKNAADTLLKAAAATHVSPKAAKPAAKPVPSSAPKAAPKPAPKSAPKPAAKAAPKPQPAAVKKAAAKQVPVKQVPVRQAPVKQAPVKQVVVKQPAAAKKAVAKGASVPSKPISTPAKAVAKEAAAPAASVKKAVAKKPAANKFVIVEAPKAILTTPETPKAK